MEDIDWDKLSDATKAEMELGRKILKENQLALEIAMRRREAEAAPTIDPEAQKAVDEAKPLEKEPAYAATGRKVKSDRT